jgi:hypothetical protein
MRGWIRWQGTLVVVAIASMSGCGGASSTAPRHASVEKPGHRVKINATRSTDADSQLIRSNAKLPYQVGRVYATDPGPSLNPNQLGPQLDQQLSGYCLYMAQQEHATTFWTYAEARSVEPGYDEIPWKTSVKILAGPFHPPCQEYASDNFYKVEVPQGTSRSGRTEAFIDVLWLR